MIYITNPYVEVLRIA